MNDLDGAVAFVTGGASGIGLGIARALLERGAKVAIADLRTDHLAEAVAACPDLLPILLDVTDRAGFAAALDEVEEKLGPLRILVNNAGIGIAGPIDEAGHADWDWGIGVNLGGVANGLVAGLPRIKAHGLGGHIVNTASLGALLPARHTRGIYAATKAAVISLSEHLRLDLAGSGIGVSVLLPGPVKTNIAESGRVRPDHLREGSNFIRYEEGAAQPRAMAPSAALTSPIAVLDPADVGRMTVEAMLADELYIVTHPVFLDAVRKRHAGIEAAMTGQ
jgi:NAD(P)-dependent dehydrogenase (short-subunit alcohol dehydrogenase family)